MKNFKSKARQRGMSAAAIIGVVIGVAISAAALLQLSTSIDDIEGQTGLADVVAAVGKASNYKLVSATNDYTGITNAIIGLAGTNSIGGAASMVGGMNAAAMNAISTPAGAALFFDYGGFPDDACGSIVASVERLPNVAAAGTECVGTDLIVEMD